ncbi:MAG: deoxyribodipyrimidine photo-lyase [Actinomycetota bacterium]
MDNQRSRKLKGGVTGSGPVAYWMSRDQRANDNWALLFSQALSHRLGKQLVVLFCLADEFLGAGDKQFLFMLEGLKETEKNLADYSIPLTVASGNPANKVKDFLKKYHIGALVTDFSPLRIKRRWTEKIIRTADIPFFEVDAHNIVPCWQASDKQEYAAYTIRPKINRLKPRFLTEFGEIKKQNIPSGFKLFDNRWHDIYRKRGFKKNLLENLLQKPGEKEAFRVMELFLENKLKSYAADRNDPNREGTSNLSAYLHFGQISAQRIALEALKFEPDDSQGTFLEELIIRKELSDNFCYYNKNYDSFAGFPRWARDTLARHMADRRPYLYSLEQLENAQTHDKLWNAAQNEMLKTGKMHGYMRMYWAKKMLEWISSPQKSMEAAIYLNDRYQMDGRDPNGYTGIAWSIGGVHDRAWNQRKVFGKIRYMSKKGMDKKFDTSRYVSRIGKIK